MRTLIFAAALLVGGAAVAQTYETTEPMPEPDATTTTTADPVPVATPVVASAAVVQPSNANPEEDARGISVISDVAYVPSGYNGIPATAMGGPVEGDDESYPPCTTERTDNCLQTYERGRSD
jgi:hypothetical protein